MKLDSRQIQKLAEEYKRIPLCREIYADLLTPIGVLKKLAARSQDYFLLESVEGQDKWGRYSFLGYDPVMRIQCREHQLTVNENGSSRTFYQEQPFDYLRTVLEQYRSPKLAEMPPFTGGFVGYFGYSMIQYAEPVLQIKRGASPDFDLMLFSKCIAFDHLRQKVILIVNMKTEDVLADYGEAMAELERMTALVKAPLPERSEPRASASAFHCNVTEEEYSRLVEKTKEYIRRGDIFQAVISRQFACRYEGSLLDAYRVLRTTNPSPYMVYFHMGERELMSTSPETLVRLEDGRLTTFPVAGSRPRGNTPDEDIRLEKELLKDEKELAEHNMLVDLGRNDLGRISEFGSVEVTRYQMIHRYSRVMHICSQVEGTLQEGKDAFDAISAVLPAGTLSGAPKIRACQIIEELEPVPRGIYGGALGYVDFAGNMDTCIAIRMAVKEKDTVYIQAGGGIVADSIPSQEYQESASKAMAVMQAVAGAGEVE